LEKEKVPKVTPGVTKLYLKVPLDRVGVLIGENGKVLKELQLRTRTKISVDSGDGTVIIEPISPSTPVYNLLKARDFVRAVSAGFPPDRAWRVLEEDQVLVVINLKEVVGDSPNHLTRIKGRIIGEGGKARKNIESMTGTYVNIHGDTVAIIGDYESAEVTREAIEMLIQGRQHSTVYKYLDKAMRELKRKRMGDLWIKRFKPL
jgi:ribosomal RNA assembly protein